MLFFIIQFIFILSFGAMLLIVARKVPVLAELSDVGENQHKFSIKKKIKVVAKRIPHSIKNNLIEFKEDISNSLQEADENKKQEIDEDEDYWTKLRQ